MYHSELVPNTALIKLCAAIAVAAVAAVCCACVLVACRGYAGALCHCMQRQTAQEAASGTEAVLSGKAEATDAFPPHLSQLAGAVGRERADRERERKAARNEAERKDDLIAYLAHDLKTPLTSVIGYADMLVEDPDMPRDRRLRYVRAVRDKGLRLEELIGELFEIARYNLRAIELSPGIVDLGVLFEQLGEEVYPMAEAHGNQLALEIGRGLRVEGDAGKLARVFGNVLRNAVAYSYEGTAVRAGAAVSEGYVTVRVSNEGPTIPPRKLDSIFERFYRLDPARSPETGGAGLGLAIAREIVERHGGSIRAESADGTTSFFVALPVARGKDAA